MYDLEGRRRKETKYLKNKKIKNSKIQNKGKKKENRFFYQ